MYTLKTFLPSETDTCFTRIREILYPEAMRSLQKSGDSIDSAIAFTGLCVEKNGIPAGRLILYKPELQIEGKKVLAAGNYECIDDPEAARLLLDGAMTIAKQEDSDAVIGPMNGTTWSNYRFAVSPINDPFFSEMIHLPYYAAQWEANGFQPLAGYISTIDRSKRFDPEGIQEEEARFLKAGIRFRNIRLENFEEELALIFPLCEKAFAGNFLFSPVSRETFSRKYLAIKPYIDPSMVFFAETPQKEIAGFAFNFPDHLCKTEKRMIVKTLVRNPRPEFAGLGNVLANLSQRFAAQNNYDAVIHALMHADNYSVTLSEKYHGELFRRYSLFIKNCS